jgi:hypothetical protein
LKPADFNLPGAAPAPEVIGTAALEASQGAKLVAPVAPHLVERHRETSRLHSTPRDKSILPPKLAFDVQRWPVKTNQERLKGEELSLSAAVNILHILLSQLVLSQRPKGSTWA